MQLTLPPFRGWDAANSTTHAPSHLTRLGSAPRSGADCAFGPTAMPEALGESENAPPYKRLALVQGPEAQRIPKSGTRLLPLHVTRDIRVQSPPVVLHTTCSQGSTDLLLHAHAGTKVNSQTAQNEVRKTGSAANFKTAAFGRSATSP